MSFSPDGHIPEVGLHIGGQSLSRGSAGMYKHIYAANGRPQAEVPLGGKKEMDAAIEAAAAAFEVWRKWRPAHRRDALNRLAALIKANAGEFARLSTIDNGTPISIAQMGAMYAEEWTSYYAGYADKLDGHVSSTYGQDGEFSYSLAEPLGVVGIIITWNGPLISLGMKVSPAIAAGNTVVVKPSEMTPFAPDLFMRLVKQAGIPDGVVNMVPGAAEAGEALVVHPKVEKISFTGGPITARKILAACAPHLKPAVLELGGKSGSLLFPDGPWEDGVDKSVMTALTVLSGQGCAMATRLIVHESLYERALERAVAGAKAVKMGDPFDVSSMAGPVVNAAAVERIMGMVSRAKSSGSARLLTGGSRLGGDFAEGFFIEPTVFADVDPQAEIAQHEVFGPVLSIMRFSTEEEAIQLCNATSYGLAAYVYSNDVKRVHRVAEQLRAGGVYVNGGSSIKPNTPFGGLGVSGYGREGGRQGIEEFIRPKTVAIA